MIQDLKAHLPRFEDSETQGQAERIRTYGTLHFAHTQLQKETLAATVGNAALPMQLHGMRERLLPSPPPLSPRFPWEAGAGSSIDVVGGAGTEGQIRARKPEMLNVMDKASPVKPLDPQLKAWLRELGKS